jgi:hypothetical protein
LQIHCINTITSLLDDALDWLDDRDLPAPLNDSDDDWLLELLPPPSPKEPEDDEALLLDPLVDSPKPPEPEDEDWL